MELALPHDLGREEVRRRLRQHAHRISDSIPGGMAEVTTSWPSEDRMAMEIGVMGQTINGHLDIEDHRIVFQLDLPFALSFIQPMVEGVLREQGRRLLAPAAG